MRYHLFNALALYPADEAEAAMREAWDGIWPVKEDFEELALRVRRIIEASDKEIADICNPEANLKERGQTVSAQRNACKPAAVGPMIELLKDESAPASLRVQAAEALGWYTLSCRRQEIYDALRHINAADPDVADEINRTLRRLEDNGHTG